MYVTIMSLDQHNVVSILSLLSSIVGDNSSENSRKDNVLNSENVINNIGLRYFVMLLLRTD